VALAASGTVTGCATLAPNPTPRYARPHAPATEVRVDSLGVEGPDLVQTARLRTADGTVVDLLVKRPLPPVDGPAPRLPLVLILGGHQAGREAARLIPEAAST
jgi:hypothetical protein